MTTVLERAPSGVTTPVAGLAVEARDIVRRYRNGRGVGPLRLVIHEGEVLALMGPNGCGKTTLLRILSTVWRPQSGGLRWFGGDARGARRHLGLSLDSALEEGGLTGRQATEFWCAQWCHRLEEVRWRTDRVLNELGIAEVADEPVAGYSFGMRRRLALAAALVHGPRLVLLDEPTAGLDPEGSSLLGRLLRAQAAAGGTAVIASNDPSFVETVADRVAFIDEGLLLRCAPVPELLAELPAGRLAEAEVDGVPDVTALRAVEGVQDVRVQGQTIQVTFAGPRTVASLVAAADAPGGRLRELRLRRPDLRDCFSTLSGRRLEDDA